MKVRYHDIHHWYPECNYGQYTMMWDWLMGSLKPYPKDDDSGEKSDRSLKFPVGGGPVGSIASENKEKAG